MKEGTGRDIEQFVERATMGLLLAALVLVILFFGPQAYQLDQVLHHRLRWPAALPGIELVIVPLAALAAARWRFAANRLISFRTSLMGPYLPWLMAGSLAGLIAYLGWSFTTPWTTIGPASEFGVVRWLGTALAAAFTVVWLPLFPRITATLAGMIAGPALFAVIGYALFGSHMSSNLGSEPAMAAGMQGLLATLVWIPGALWLSHRTRLGDVVRRGRHPLIHASWSGAVMLCLTAVGTDIGELF